MKDSYWFRHDVNARRDEKIIDLIADLGYEGYGIFWALIEYLRECAYYEAEYKPKRLSVALGVGQDLIEQVVKGYKLFHLDENGMFYSSSLKSRMKEMDRSREMQREKANKRWHPTNAKEPETDPECHGITTALPTQSHKITVEHTRLENSKAKKSTPDERVQGEKGEKSFFSECLEVRNSHPVVLIFEYLYFVWDNEFKTLKENRSNFINYWRDSKPEKNKIEIKKRLIGMTKIGFVLSIEQCKEQIDKFMQKQTQERSEVDSYKDFLEQLKSEGFEPSESLNGLASGYLKF